MGGVLGLFRGSLGPKEDETRNTYNSESQSRVRQPPLQPGHNAPTRYESSWTTPSSTSSPCIRSQSKTQATSTTTRSSETVHKPKVVSPSTRSSETVHKPKVVSPSTRSSETVHKPKVVSPSTLQYDSFSPKPRLHSSKPTLSEAPFSPTMDQNKTNYIWVEKGTATHTYKVPEDVEALIKNNKLPGALKMRLSPSTYKDFFHTMLYAEDLYFEEWDGFEMENVALELENAAIYRRKSNDKNMNKTHLEEEDVKYFVAFEMDSVPYKRPFLLSRDFASVRPSGSNDEPFQGIIYRVVKSNRVLVEFGEDFHSQHYQGRKYSVKFSFNRICLKRAHHAIDSVSDSLFKNFLFPTRDCSSKVNMLLSQPSYMHRNLDPKQFFALGQIYRHHYPPPYLIEGLLCITETTQQSMTGRIVIKQLSRTGILVCEAILHTYQTKPDACILICAPSNITCDELVKSLLKEIPESSIFRANAAFREREEVLLDIIPSCRISGDCFSCPSLKELQKFKVVSSTYMSCFRLHNEGLKAGHFSHMFMLDASSTTEPEALVALAHFAHESTNVVVTGAVGNSSRWVRSPIARKYGLMKSYFERLYEGELHNDVCHL